MQLKNEFKHTIPLSALQGALTTFTVGASTIECIPNVTGVDVAFDYPNAIISWAGNAGSNQSKDRVDFPHADKISLMIEADKPVVRTFRVGFTTVEIVCVYRKGDVDVLIKVRHRSKVVYIATVNRGKLKVTQDLITPPPQGEKSWRKPNSRLS